MTMQYNAPPTVPSDVGPTVITQYHIKKSLVDLPKETYFGQLASVVNMPKNMGKKISQYLYLPMLDDRNINDQGIDANGVTLDKSKFSVVLPLASEQFTVEAEATAAASAVNAVSAGTAVKSGAASPWTVTYSKRVLDNATQAQANAVLAAVGGSRVGQTSGNLYGSSKDIGTILGKLPMLGENGGRVNRVGVTRVLREGTLTKMGFFTEITQEAKDFDDDPQLGQQISDALLNGANEIVEDTLQIDLLTQAGVVLYPGAATKNSDLTGEGATPSTLSYGDLDRLAGVLIDNRTPMQTKILSGSRMVDTKTIGSAFVAFIGRELLPVFRAMKDLHGNPAFISVHHYAANGDVLNGEVGTVGDFRLVVVPEMTHWAGVGATVGTNPGYRATGGKYNVYPMLVVGAESFSAIGFQTDGKEVKFKIITKVPGEQTADRTDPYGETGFTSIKWYYGTLITRPERIAVAKSVAKV